MAKKGKNALQELTELEFYKIEAEDKYAKYEKEISRYKKTIANLKRKDRLFTKAISLCETKITNNKESSMNSLLFLCENIKVIKNNLANSVAKLNSREQVYFDSFEKELDYIMSSLYNICNKIEENSMFTKDDREVISSRFEMSDLAEVDESEGFAKLTEVFKQNLLKRNHKKLDSNGNPIPEKPMEECIEDFGDEDGRVVYNEEYYNEQLKVQNAFNKMFYEAPTNSTKVTSNIDDNGVFDFNEALNPTLSLSDIMNDLMGDGDDDDDEDFDFGFPPPSNAPKSPKQNSVEPKPVSNKSVAQNSSAQNLNTQGSKPQCSVTQNTNAKQNAQTKVVSGNQQKATTSQNPSSSSNANAQPSTSPAKPAPKTAMSKQTAKLNSIAMQNSNLIQPKKEKTFAELGFDDEDDEPEDDYIYNSNFSSNLVTFDEDDDFDDDFDELDDEERENQEFLKNKQAQLEQIESKMAQNSKIERRVIDEPKKTTQKNENQDYEKKFTFIQNLFKKNKK